MKRIILTCIVLVGSMFAFSPLAAAKPDKPPKAESAKSIAKEKCKALKKADKAAFAALYGSNSIGKCVKAETQTSGGEPKNAAKACKAERASDPQAFEDKYGSAKGNNAFGECVSAKDDDEADNDVDEADDDQGDDNDDQGDDNDDQGDDNDDQGDDGDE